MRHRIILLVVMLFSISIVNQMGVGNDFSTASAYNSQISLLAQADDKDVIVDQEAVVEEGPMDADMDEEVLVEEDKTPQEIMSTIIGILIIVVVLAAIGHMLFIIFFKEKTLPELSMEAIKTARATVGKSEEATDEENEQCRTLLMGVWNDHFTKFKDENGEEKGVVTTKRNMEAMRQNMEQVEQIMPTDPELVEYYNSYAGVFNDCQKRVFAGSKLFIGLAVATALFMGWVGESWNMIPFFAVSIGIYWLSVMKPSFMIYSNICKGKTQGRGFMNAIFGGLFGAVATATTYKTIIKYDDGTKETHTDNSETWITLLFALIISIIVVLFMAVVALINYLRNYVIYK